jgi:hypothetical protein
MPHGPAPPRRTLPPLRFRLDAGDGGEPGRALRPGRWRAPGARTPPSRRRFRAPSPNPGWTGHFPTTSRWRPAWPSFPGAARPGPGGAHRGEVSRELSPSVVRNRAFFRSVPGTDPHRVRGVRGAHRADRRAPGRPAPPHHGPRLPGAGAGRGRGRTRPPGGYPGRGLRPSTAGGTPMARAGKVGPCEDCWIRRHPPPSSPLGRGRRRHRPGAPEARLAHTLRGLHRKRDRPVVEAAADHVVAPWKNLARSPSRTPSRAFHD